MQKAFMAWSGENSLEWGAALAYYTAFSMAPLLIIALTIVGVFYKGDSLSYLRAEMAGLLGTSAAAALTGAIRSIHTSDHGTLANVVSVVVLLIGASGAFVQLQSALNRVWGVQPKPGHFWSDLVKQRLISFAMILGISFLLLVSLIISAALAAITGYFEYLLPGAGLLWHVLDFVVSFAIVVGLFASIFKIVPDVHIDWQDVWVGSVVTAILFVVGKMAIGFYLGRSGVGSAYGAAGSLLIILAWVYYSSQILFFGSEFTKFYADERRHPVRPIQGAEAVTQEAEDRAKGLVPPPTDDRKIA
jgi:membrane protein